MSAIERVMKAYTSTHDLTPEQTRLVRVELSNFINELMSVRRSPISDSSHRDAETP
jgi:hypothetical protein